MEPERVFFLDSNDAHRLASDMEVVAPGGVNILREEDLESDSQGFAGSSSSHTGSTGVVGVGVRLACLTSSATASQNSPQPSSGQIELSVEQSLTHRSMKLTAASGAQRL